MKLHRFFVDGDIRLKNDFWLHDESLLWQWNRVLRFRPGQKIGLFNGETDRFYEIKELSKKEAHLVMITEREPVVPKRHVYLFWSLLKKDNNELVLQKGTELGVSNFVPILSERTIKTDFNISRARKIITEATEQCGRSDLAVVREPIHLEKVLDQYKDDVEFLVFDQDGESEIKLQDNQKYGLLIGPEGGWSDAEKELFKSSSLKRYKLSGHTLRAETASIIALGKIL